MPRWLSIVGILLAIAVGTKLANTAIQDWSVTASSNNATPPDGFPESQAPSTVNNSAREVMAQVRRFAEQLVLGTFGPDGGSATAYFITPAIAPSATFVSGARFTLIPSNNNTSATPTLKIGTIGPLTIAKISNQALVAGDIVQNTPADFIYHGALGGLILLNPQSNIASQAQIGKQTVWIPAGAFISTTTSGATISTAELSTNKVMQKALAYDGAQQEFAQFNVGMPKSWNLGTVSGQFYWTFLSGTGTVQWYLQCTALNDASGMDTAFGTARGITDTNLTANQMHISSETAAVTVAGTPASGSYLQCQVYRDAPADSSTTDAHLLGMKFFYTTNAGNDN